MSPIIKFSALQWFFFSAWSTFGAFNVYYLGEIGYSNTFIGTALSVLTLAGILGQPVLGYICDRQQTVKKVFVLSMLLLAIIVLFYPFYRSVYLLIMALAAIGFLWQPQQSIIDTWIFRTSPELGRRYGVMRGFGSFGFAAFAVCFGYVIERFGWNTMFVAHGILSLTAIAVALTIPDVKRPVTDTPSDERANVDIRKLFKIREYVFLLIVALLLSIPNRFVISFLPAILRSVGGTPVHQGTALFVNAFSEVPILLASSLFLGRFATQPLLLFASLFFALRLVIVILAESPGAVVLSGLMQGLSFGVFLPTARYLINRIAPEELKTSAQTIATGVYMGVSGVLSSFAGGFLLDLVGVRKTLLVSMIFTLSGTILLAMVVMRNRQFKSLAFKHRA